MYERKCICICICMQESTTSRTNVGLSTAFFRCVRKGHELAAAAAAAGGIPREGGEAETCYTWKTMGVDVFGEEESV